MLRLIVAASCVLAVLSYAQVDETLNGDWELYKTSYNKVYKTEKEEYFRRIIWEEHVGLIARHNREYDMGIHTYTLGINEFADMSSKEFVSKMNGYRRRRFNATKLYSPPTGDVSIATEVDWRDKGYVTKVKNQGSCGSCWTFSSTGALEGQWAKNTGKLVDLSEQNLLDCSKGYNEGCNGGIMEEAFDYIRKNGGIDTEKSYPYEEREGKCRYDVSKRGATCSGYVSIEEGNEDHLESAVANVGPVSIAIDASHSTFQFYSGGIYNEKTCSPTWLDHAVLAVGYGVNRKGREYWLVKNSWGSDWGKGGYVRMSKNKNNQCGIATQASYPTV